MTTTVTELWLQVHDSLRAFIAKRVADESAVDDILQEVFLRMHRGIDGLKDPRRVVSWVYRITRHAIIDHYRAPARRREMPVGLAADIETAGHAPATSVDSDSAESGAQRSELAGCLRPMIEQLDKDYREALMLVEFDGLTQQAAAKRMGLSLSGMKSRVQRGRQQLKRKLDECCLIQLDGRHAVADYTVRDPKRPPC
jgi:RNA polymerase sigma-70 factor (ECF subfamily)